MVKNTSPILAALRAATQNETAAVEFVESQRWPIDAACPRCGSLTVYKMTGRDGQRNKDYRWRCKDCKKMFTVRTGTVFEETRLPMRVWIFAFWKACASKKGISALQLSREMEITHKSALFVLRRIRHGVGVENAPKLNGTVEADETYVGGRPRYPSTVRGRRPLSLSGKSPVVGVVSRGGNVRLQMMERVTANRIAEAIAENVSLSSRLMTDENNVYIGIGRKFAGGHQTTMHSRKEYVKAGDVHSNTIDSVFSLLKRGVMGTFHSVSKKHLPNYLNEFEFRWNTRKDDDGTRVSKAFRAINGKRLEYRESVDNPPYVVG